MELTGPNNGSSMDRKGMIQVLPINGDLTPVMKSFQRRNLNVKALHKNSEHCFITEGIKLDSDGTKSIETLPSALYSPKKVPIQCSTFISPSTWESFDEIPSTTNVGIVSNEVNDEPANYATKNHLPNINGQSNVKIAQADASATNFQTLHDEIAQMQQELAAINVPMQEHNDWLLHQFEEVNELLKKQKKIEKTMDVVKTQNQSIKRKIETGFPVRTSSLPSGSQLNPTSPHSSVNSFVANPVTKTPKVLVVATSSTKSPPTPPPKPTKKPSVVLASNCNEFPVANHVITKTNQTNNPFHSNEFKEQKIRKAPSSLILPMPSPGDSDSKESLKSGTSSLRIKPPLSPKPTILTIKVFNKKMSAPRDRIAPLKTSTNTQSHNQAENTQHGSFTPHPEPELNSAPSTPTTPSTLQNTSPIPSCTPLQKPSTLSMVLLNPQKLKVNENDFKSELAIIPVATFKAGQQVISPTNSSTELMEQIRQFSQTGQVLKKIPTDKTFQNGSRTRIRKNSMQDALQNRLQAFCGTTNSSEESESENDDEQWDD